MADADLKKNLLLFFERPTEPCFMQKGEEMTNFDIPDHYYPDKYKRVRQTLSDRFGSGSGRTVHIENLSIPDLDLSLPLKLGFNDHFSLFMPEHRKMAGYLIDLFMGMRNVEDLLSLCSFCQMRINPYMFNYCLNVALLHRRDTKGLNIPTFAETFPDKFMDPKVFKKAREVSTTFKFGNKPPIVIPKDYTASAEEPEQRMAYFREDIGVNLHHWHWHLVYPFSSAKRSIVNKDRRGELFYYMHQQIIARYNVDRMCNDLRRVRMLDDFRQPIEDAYFPKLDSQVAGRVWPARFPDTVIRDVNRVVDEIKVDVRDLETWRDRFVEAIDNNAILLKNNRLMPLDEMTGIDILGNLMEASMLSKNPGYYGDLHNMGHVLIAFSHDPDHRHLEQSGVMGDLATAMRDPAFYRWHAYVDSLFQLYKSKLPNYTTDQLDFPGIHVSSVSVQGAAGVNTFSTFLEESTINIGRGLDFSPVGSVLAKFTHLQHEEFEYVIEVNNTIGRGVTGTVRIFMAPVVDEDGNQLELEVQRKMMIEMDKFSQPLSTGRNIIRRSSVDSSVTIPFERTFRDQSTRPGEQGTEQAAEFDFCGCGWPHHMLVPKGNTQGYPVVLFAMVSNWDDDKVVEKKKGMVGSCNDAASYCGIRDRKYPDRRSMGFPFDRAAPAPTLQDFLMPNMAVSDCTVRFADRTRVRGQP